MLLTLGGCVLINISKKSETLSFQADNGQMLWISPTQPRIAEVYMPG